MPTGTSFEADLRATRDAADLSLADIQQKTRIPVDVLRRFEEGDLIGDPTYNEVYLKAFLQSYAKAVGVAPSAVLAAFAEQKRGGYSGSLHPETGGAPASSPGADAPPPVATPDAAATEPPVSDAPAASRAAPARPPSSVPPAVQALQNAPPPAPRPVADGQPKTLAQARVNRPVVPTAKRSFDKNWGTILGLFAVLVVALAGALYVLVFADDDTPDVEPDTVVVGSDETATPIDSSGIGAGAATGGPRLQLPIQVTLTAVGGKLQNFRVTEAPNERLGYWLEEGASETFESDSLIVLWGEGAEGIGPNAQVELQGQRWTPNTGAVLRIDRARGQAILDSLAATPQGPAGNARPAAPLSPDPDVL